MRPEEPAPPSLADVVARRKAEYARLAGLDLPNTLWESVLPRLVGQHAAAAPGRPDLRGIPLSSGHAEGRAAVLHSPNDLDRMHPGDVLVAPVIGPGWTALFPLAAGIVVEMGGTLSHGAIVAREYGLPGVINVHGAMQALHDGDRIRVDADAGRVEVLSCEHDP